MTSSPHLGNDVETLALNYGVARLASDGVVESCSGARRAVVGETCATSNRRGSHVRESERFAVMNYRTYRDEHRPAGIQ